MGYSPGDFICRKHGKVHLELKDGDRVVLWNADESEKLLDLERAEFYKMLTDMNHIWDLVA